MTNRYRKKPVVIEAIQWTGENLKDVLDFTGKHPDFCLWFGSFEQYEAHVRQDRQVFKIKTLEGTMEATPGDWIIKGVKGEFYQCKPDIFAATYEPADARRATPDADDLRAENERLRGVLEMIAEQAEKPEYRSLEVGFRHSPLSLSERTERLAETCQAIAQDARAALRDAQGGTDGN